MNSSDCGGAVYESIVYNEDNTITLTDKNGVVHTMECEYTDGKTTSVKYDGKAIELAYDGDVLVKVGGTVVDVNNAPASGGTSLNIAFGEEPPEDTSKLWIKANEPANIKCGNNIDGVESVKTSGVYVPSGNSDRLSVAKIGTKFYLFDGQYIRLYDLETNSISTLTNQLPEWLGTPFPVVKGAKIYLFGGNTKGKIYVFDTKTETTELLSATAFNRLNCPYALVGNKRYCFGGTSNGYPQNYINVYDLETETYSSLSVTLPSVRYGICAEVIGTKIYLFGGWGASTFYNSIYIFDTETDTIQTIDATLPEGVEGACCSKIGNKIYLFGGRGDSTYTNAINVFDTETETIETLETTLPNADYGISCYTDGTNIYLFGGNKYGESINIFTLTHELQQGNIEIETSTVKNRFKLINTDMTEIECGVENVYIGNENNEAVKVEAYLHNGTEWMVIE
jgi:N-acetylneuraminic acid mutarotase